MPVAGIEDNKIGGTANRQPIIFDTEQCGRGGGDHGEYAIHFPLPGKLTSMLSRLGEKRKYSVKSNDTQAQKMKPLQMVNAESGTK